MLNAVLIRLINILFVAYCYFGAYVFVGCQPDGHLAVHC